MKLSLQAGSGCSLKRETPEQPGMPTYCFSNIADLSLHYVELEWVLREGHVKGSARHNSTLI